MILLDLPLAREYFMDPVRFTTALIPNVVHSTRSAEIARALVAGGFGFTILNIRYAERRPTARISLFGRSPGPHASDLRHRLDCGRAPAPDCRGFSGALS